MGLLSKIKGEQGSLPLAMLAVFVVGSLVAVLTGTVIVGQRASGRDQNFEQSIHIAEQGLDRLIFMVQDGSFDETTEPSTLAGTSPSGEDYTATVTRMEDGDWHLISTGTSRDGVERTVESWIRLQRPFTYGALGRQFLLTRGGGSADAYDSAVSSRICKEHQGEPTTQTVNPFNANDTDVLMCHQVFDPPATVATNGELTLLGQTIHQIGRAEVHHSRQIDDARSDATGACIQSAQACADVYDEDTNPDGKLHHYREPLPLSVVELPLDIEGNQITPTGAFPADTDTPRAWRKDEADPTDTGADDANLRRPACVPAVGKDSCLGPGVHAFTDAVLDFGVDYQGTVEDPVIMYVTGKVTVRRLQAGDRNRQGVVNFERVTGGTCDDEAVDVGCWQPRPPSTLQIFSMGGGPTLNFGGKASFSGAVYAPHAAFDAEQNGNFYGSLVANGINNSAQWNFHYDIQLANVATDAPRIASSWAEVVGR